jgi:hypothetical protein
MDVSEATFSMERTHSAEFTGVIEPCLETVECRSHPIFLYSLYAYELPPERLSPFRILDKSFMQIPHLAHLWCMPALIGFDHLNIIG